MVSSHLDTSRLRNLSACHTVRNRPFRVVRGNYPTPEVYGLASESSDWPQITSANSMQQASDPAMTNVHNCVSINIGVGLYGESLDFLEAG